MSKYKEYLKSIGAPAAHITALEKAEADDKSELDVTPLIEEYKSVQKKLMENDPDLVTEIARKEKGKLLDIWTKKIRTEFALEASDVKDKPLEDVIKLAKEKTEKGMSKDIQTVQQENVDLIAKVKDFEEIQIPKIKAEVENQKKGFLINQKLQKKLPIADLRVPIETVDLVLNSQLAALYDLDTDDKGEVVIYGKGTKLQATSTDKSKLLTLDDVIGDILKKNKFVKESNADDVDPLTGKKKDIQPAGDTKKVDQSKLPLGQRKAIEHAENLKKSQETAAK